MPVVQGKAEATHVLLTPIAPEVGSGGKKPSVFVLELPLGLPGPLVESDRVRREHLARKGKGRKGKERQGQGRGVDPEAERTKWQ